tara:strand:- start:3474 stop:5624 length:2151 start_codon:yes stop_codon:yes gene_type:complete
MALTQSSEGGLKISNAGTNGQYLQKQSGNTGGLTWADVPAGVGGATGLDVNDSVKIRLGNSNDLEIYHSGSHSFIDNQGTGVLHVCADDLRLKSKGDDETFITAVENGAVSLYYDNGKKFETTSTGTLVGGIIQAKQNSGNAAQTLLKLTNNDTTASGETGQTADIEFEFTDNTNTTYKAAKIGAYKAADWVGNVDYDAGLKFFTVNNSASFENTYTERLVITENGELKIPDNGKFVAGAGSDLQIYHDGGDNIILSNGASCDLLVYVANGELAMKAVANGAVELYHNNVKKFETNSGGVSLTGSLVIAGDDVRDDGYKSKWGTGDDLQIYHNGSHSYIDEAGTGDLYIRSASNIRLTDTSDNKMILCQDGGEVQLYYDGTEKAHTTTTGLRLDDSDKLEIGTSADLQLYHDGSNSHIKNTTNSLYIDSAEEVQLRNISTEKYFRGIKNGAAELYYDNVKHFATASGGVTVFGAEGGNANIQFWADEGDDTADMWLMQATTAGEFRILSYAAGSWETRLSLAPSDDGPLTIAAVDSGVTNGGIKLANANQGSKFYATGNTTASIMLFYNPANGNVGSIKTVGTATQFNTSSDYRLKENEVPLENAITKLKALKPYTFNFKKQPSEKVDGFYAHEAQSVVPVAVTGTKDEMAPTYYEAGDTIPSGKKVGDWTGQYSDTEINPQGVDYGKFTPLLTKALQEAIAKIETLETKVAALEG